MPHRIRSLRFLVAPTPGLRRTITATTIAGLLVLAGCASGVERAQAQGWGALQIAARSESAGARHAPPVASESLPAGDGRAGGVRDLPALFAGSAALAVLMSAPLSVLPLQGARVTSGFGMRRHPISGRLKAHEGVDFVSDDRRVRAAGDGVVRFAGRRSGYGNLVVIEHLRGFETRYAHLSELAVEVGQVVSPADLVGVMGSTGYSTGIHLHFELRHQGRALDPATLLATGEMRGALASLQ